MLKKHLFNLYNHDAACDLKWNISQTKDIIESSSILIL